MWLYPWYFLKTQRIYSPSWKGWQVPQLPIIPELAESVNRKKPCWMKRLFLYTPENERIRPLFKGTIETMGSTSEPTIDFQGSHDNSNNPKNGGCKILSPEKLWILLKDEHLQIHEDFLQSAFGGSSPQRLFFFFEMAPLGLLGVLLKSYCMVKKTLQRWGWFSYPVPHGIRKFASPEESLGFVEIKISLCGHCCFFRRWVFPKIMVPPNHPF